MWATAEALHEWNLAQGVELPVRPGQIPSRAVPLVMHDAEGGFEYTFDSGLRRSHASLVRELAQSGWWPPSQPPPPPA